MDLNEMFRKILVNATKKALNGEKPFAEIQNPETDDTTLVQKVPEQFGSVAPIFDTNYQDVVEEEVAKMLQSEFAVG